MKKLAVMLVLTLSLASAARAEKVVFAYGNSCLCRDVEKVVKEFGKGWRLLCYMGNPYKDAKVLKIWARAKPEVIMFPQELFPLMVYRNFTGDIARWISLGKVYFGVWAGSRSKDAGNLLEYLKKHLNKRCLSSAYVSPGGWWLYQLSNTRYQEKYTPIASPIKGIKAGIFRYKVGKIPQKAFLVKMKPRPVLSTLEGIKKASFVGNVYLHPALWGKDCSVKRLKAIACRALNIPQNDTLLLFTGVDMDNLGYAEERFGSIVVWAVATAGVLGNARRAGIDKGEWLEENGKWRHVGTINILVFTNRRLSQKAMLQAIIRITEAKTAVLQELNVESSYTPGATATGTGTDNIIIVPGIKGKILNSCGGHTKIAELMEKAVIKALYKAIYNQNGIERNQTF